MKKRVCTGFLYAIEAVIASIMMLTFINFGFETPAEIDWSEVNLKHYTKDIMSGLDRLGILENLSSRQDLDSFNAIIGVLKPKLKLSLKWLFLPKKEIFVGIALGDDDTYVFKTVKGDWNGKGLPKSENNVYAQGKAFGVKFVLSDSEIDGKIIFNTVNFDFNNNGNFNNFGEGPFEHGGTFSCNTKNCKGNFQVGFSNNGLILYNASLSSILDELFGEFKMKSIKSSFSFSNFNPKLEGFGSYDIILTLHPGVLEENVESLKEFLKEDRSIIEVWNKGPLYENFGIKDLDYKLEKNGAPVLKFSDNSIARKISMLFHNSEIRVNNISRDFSLDNRTLFIRGWNVEGIYSADGEFLAGTALIKGEKVNILLAMTGDEFDRAYFSNNGEFSNESYYEVGNSVLLNGNSYEIVSIEPFVIIPERPYLFREMPLVKISGEKIIRLVDYKYKGAEILASAFEINERPDGVPISSDEKYYVGEFELENKYGFVITNVVVDMAEKSEEISYVNFDLNENGNYDDVVNGTKEGIYQNGSEILLDGRKFEIEIKNNSLKLTEIPESVPGVISVNEDLVLGHGAYVIIPEISKNLDEISILRSVMVYLSTKIEKGDFKVMGNEAFLLSYPAVIEGDGKFVYPYIIEVVWWK